jgi:16S rRNA (adenine(1408)-N(1))-methyltransferase
LSNLLFVQAAVETLPAELEGVAHDVCINFPWGSLLRAVGLGETLVLRNVRRICSPNARLKVFLGLDSERDRAEIERLALPTLSTDFVSAVLAPKYREAGFEIVETESLPSSSPPEMHTSWARRLQRSSRRSFLRIVAQAIGEE